jgi:hypothetical protein
MDCRNDDENLGYIIAWGFLNSCITVTCSRKTLIKLTRQLLSLETRNLVLFSVCVSVGY